MTLSPACVVYPGPFEGPRSPRVVADYEVSALMGVATEEMLDTITSSPSPPVVPITSNEDLTAFLANASGLVLVDSDTEAAVPCWDFTTTGDGGGFLCPWGDHCRNIVAADGNGYLIIGENWSVRMWRFESETEPVYAWLQAPNESFPAGLEWARQIVDGMTVE